MAALVDWLQRQLAHQRRVEVARVDQAPHQLVAQLLRVLEVRHRLLLVARGHAHRDEQAEQVGRGADRRRHQPRAAVVAGDQAPQTAAGDDRDRHRRGHAHVAQVFEVDRRHAAQRVLRQIQRAALGGDAGHDRLRHVVDVRDHPQAVAQVQRARLRRDVRGRVAQAEVGVHVVGHGLGDHLAGAVVQKAVDHHAVVAGELAHLRGDVVVEVAVRVLRDRRDHRLRERGRLRRRAALVARLDLDVHEVVGDVHHKIAGGAERAEVGLARALRERAGADQRLRVEHRLQHVLAEVIAQAMAEQRVHRHVEQLVDVGGHVTHGPIGHRAADEIAVRLDRAGEVDRFLGAAVGIDGGHSGHAASPDRPASRQCSTHWKASLAPSQAQASSAGLNRSDSRVESSVRQASPRACSAR